MGEKEREEREQELPNPHMYICPYFPPPIHTSFWYLNLTEAGHWHLSVLNMLIFYPRGEIISVDCILWPFQRLWHRRKVAEN